MPRIQYKEINFGQDRLQIIQKVNNLIATYSAQGYTLTLRQLYYQFVARDWIRNKQQEYKRLGDIVSDGRLAGLIDWKAIEDRTRELGENPHWQDSAQIVEICGKQFRLDKWDDQPYRVEVWVEKDALEGVVGKAAKEMDIAYFSCRGYTSQTSMWEAGQRLIGYIREGQKIVILHLGDHDPSGIDMSRDIQERLYMFTGGARFIFKTIALNEDQIAQYNPPPNPAKTTDSRYNGYRDRYGDDSWELDALDPWVIHQLIIDNVLPYRDDDLYQARADEELSHRKLLTAAADRWVEVADFLS